MALKNCKSAIIFSSVTGNTRELIEIINSEFHRYAIFPAIYPADIFPLQDLKKFDAIIVGTYTWGNGNIPKEMVPIFQAFEQQDVKNTVTGVVGTGDSFYPYFCGAVDEFRDMLFLHSTLAVTLKVELRPQEKDLTRCKRFVEAIVKRLELQQQKYSLL
ncbi:flavodoxin [Bacillus sp. FJAT-27225]|uniref:flavodoxin domain-containing protein n=1 Tax=Bacillus sp. FJAT-27225 TaxID=1743144 RepID=UPI00080C27D4|nr:flavodoxin domain-containing protein [Bacillus sp. FJAT-27225]OCA85797.1 flavodoxin [Bacillus sp. FJAT-27225]